MRANLYQESSDLDRALSSFSNVVTFSGVVVSNTLDAAYTAKAFIRALNPGGQNALAGSVPFVPLPAAGQFFSVSTDTASLVPGLVTQVGFQVTGLNANPANAATLGSVVVTGNLDWCTVNASIGA
jgi:hypothetical protein